MKKVASLITILVAVLTLNIGVFALSDINEHWGKPYIEYLVRLNAIGGYPDGTFKPDNAITRAEFTKILIVSLGVKPSNTQGEHWAVSYTKEATTKGYLLTGEFDDIDKNITRGEIARMIVRAMKSIVSNPSEFAGQISDYSTIPEEYQEYVLKAYTSGIVAGYEDGSFKYNKTATRAEASTMLVRLKDESKRKIPVLIKQGAIFQGDRKVDVASNEVIETYNKIVTSIKNTEGSVKSTYVDGMSSVAIYYTSEMQIDNSNITLVIDCYIDNADTGTQYLLNIKKYDEKTYKALKEAIEIFYPTSYEEVYTQLMAAINSKEQTQEMEFDGRSFYGCYLSGNNSTYVYVGSRQN